MSKNWSLILIIAFVLGFGIKAYLDKSSQPADPPAPETITLYGQGHQAVRLFDPQDQRIRIVYFGFTRCADVCPTSLAMLAGALNQLDAQTLEQLRPIFISLDPERDNADATATYAQYFHPQLEGLSAPLAVTTSLAHRYGVIFRKTELPDSELKYTLDHSSYFYFLSPDGQLLTKVPHTLNPAPIVEAIKQTLTTSSKGQ